MIRDGRSIADGVVSCDLCVVGAGPAGISIVDRLRDSGLSIVLSESGGLAPDAATQRLSRGEQSGQRYYDLDTCRYRVFGGSTMNWGGWCRPLDSRDFMRRAWVPFSGWPIGEDALRPYYPDAASLLELPDADFDLDAWRERLPPPFPLDGAAFENAIFQYSPRTDFGKAYGARLNAAPNVVIITHANLIGMQLTNESNRVETLQFGTLGGQRFVVRPRAVVLAAGGIENARLLLAARTDRPAGIGNEHDLVGRFFMEHPHVPAGHLLADPPAVNRDFYQQRSYDGVELRGVVTPTVEAIQRRQLLAVSIAIEPEHHCLAGAALPTPMKRRAMRLIEKARIGGFAPLCDAVTHAAVGAATMRHRYRAWKKSRDARARASAAAGNTPMHALFMRAEQAPDPDNRVTLSERRDALGVPQAKLHWRLTRIDREALSAWLIEFDRTVREQNLGRVVFPLDDWLSEVVGGPHHMGTTRMSADPRHGVVDEHCRVHSVENLYIAGSSVFPTGGYANPTFTIVALALRLADTLKTRLQSVERVHSHR